MGSVGLLYVGAVLFLNGCMLLGWVDTRAAVPLNIFVGILQVITPTYLIFTADGNTTQIMAASGLYLFGFTYLYVAMNLWNATEGALQSTSVSLPSLRPAAFKTARRPTASSMERTAELHQDPGRRLRSLKILPFDRLRHRRSPLHHPTAIIIRLTSLFYLYSFVQYIFFSS